MSIMRRSIPNMEINNTQENKDKAANGSKNGDLIQVRAILTCPNGDYHKKFINQFLRKDLELLTVTLKVFDWLTCNKCGELLKLDLEFNV
ncbi:MAG: hypothetical protein ACW96S_14210 [Promethearchaeota archaeon]